MVLNKTSRFDPVRGAVTAWVFFTSLTLITNVSAETVLITGSNSGIGLEFAKQYAAQGWMVIATRRRSEIPETLAELKTRYGEMIRIETLDVTNLEQAVALQEKLKDVPVDVLLNNSGVYNDRSKCAQSDDGCPGDWSNQSFGNQNFQLLDTIMAVNIKGPLIVSQVFYPNVKASKRNSSPSVRAMAH